MVQKHKKVFDYLIIGAGVHGLFTAYYLSKKRDKQIALIDQFNVGNSQGSSHGTSRIIRSIYPNSLYINLLQIAKEIGWNPLEKQYKRPLIYPNPACYFGSGNTFNQYTETVLKSGLDIQALSVVDAKKKYPQFNFPSADSVLEDKTSGVIAAKTVLDCLLKESLKNNVQLFENTKALDIEFDQDPIKIKTNHGDFFTERLIITAGPWVQKLIPALTEKVKPIKQIVAYFKLEGEVAQYQRGSFPNWASIRDGKNNLFYGLPLFDSEGIKVSQHITFGRADDPDNLDPQEDQKQLDILTDFVKENFTRPIEKLVAVETCFYANTQSENFILDYLPSNKRVVIGSACSGHGFKFAPIVGKILTELCLNEKTSFEEFETSKELFSIERN